ncbi:DUF4328 domain-containing protein [Erythrobacter sp. EC-HK427]|uniref:DUF4328 domain-containing protein n=1 Tax=Erythrobacter sp. EC-HK427 TaxID=2038396 RepID=UPI001F2A357B|nr:DUF4328 domain-containing protein [Erythrobacter sp. EC-HK427]
MRIVLLIFVGTCAMLILMQLTALAVPDLMLSSSAAIIGFAAWGLGIIQLLVFLAAIVLVALWVHAAHSHLHDSRVQGLNYQPGWATASFFIPFINLYVPFASTRELYNRSHGESDWHAAIPAGDVTSWAACNWAALLMFSVIVGYVFVDSIQFVHVIMPIWGWLGLSILLYTFLAGSAWYLAQIVTKVTYAQVNGAHQSQSDVFA